MRYTRFIIPFVLAFVLAACIPQIGGGDIASLTAEREGEVVTATLQLNQDAEQVLVLFTWDGGERRVTPGDLEAGVHMFSVAQTARVACSASGNVGNTYWLVFCSGN